MGLPTLEARLKNARDLLDRAPEASFDLAEFLLSARYSDYLAQHLSDFHRSLKASSPLIVTPEVLTHTLRAELARTVPAYADCGTAAFDEIPFSDRDRLKSEFERFVPSAFDLTNARCIQTSGTTGQPLTVLYDPAFYFQYLHLTVPKMALIAGIELPADHSVFSVVIDSNPALPEFVTLAPLHEFGPTFRLLISETKRSSFERLFEILHAMKPLVIVSRPSVLEAVIAYAHMVAAHLDFPIALVASAGSFLSESIREEAQSLFGAPVICCYGLIETGLVASECNQQDGYHIDQTCVLAEIIAEDGRRLPDGDQGEIVLSNVRNAAMPLLRYRTGDVGSISNEVCGCGLRSPRIEAISGRKAFHYRFSGGLILHPARFDPLFWRFPVREIQVIQTRRDQLEILVEPLGTASGQPGLMEEIDAFTRTVVPSSVALLVRESEFHKSPNHQRHLTQVKGPG